MNAQQQAHDLDAVFLREVVERPKDDAPLLIYADWLMDQDDPAAQTRGEYLRLCSLLESVKAGPARADLRWRTQQLWWDNVESWLGAVFGAVDHFLYERGRLCVELSGKAFARAHADDLAAAPAWHWITDVVVREGDLDLLLHLGRLPRPRLLASLDVGRRTLVEGELEYLLEEGFWDAPAELVLHHNWLGDCGARGLARWPGVVGVRVLDLEATVIGPEGIQALVQSPYLGELDVLDLEGNGLFGDVSWSLDQRYPHLDWAGWKGSRRKQS